MEEDGEELGLDPRLCPFHPGNVSTPLASQLDFLAWRHEGPVGSEKPLFAFRHLTQH